ncbi:unnamed protein product [Mytilus coruscus]|uniref:Uncharacterized protein n=1 Tax=Mytilus coruscus TaxID=42192 RepID=A0A6J8AHC7_MYTCO|nr:unnamed protein product [Mytilus coruscus]
MAQIRPHDSTQEAMKRLGDLDEIIVKQHLMNFGVKGRDEIIVKQHLMNFGVQETKDKEVGILQDLSHAFTEENKSGITNEFKLTFSEKLSVSEKALILSAAFLIDIFYMDHGLLRTHNINTMTGETVDVVFYNCKYNMTRRFPGGYQKQINPLF